MLLVYMVSKRKTILALGAVPPLLLTYQHLYDLLPLAVFLLVLAENKVGGALPFVIFFTFLSLPINIPQIFSIILFIYAFQLFDKSQRISLPRIILLTPLLIPLFTLKNESIEIQYSYLSGLVAIVGILLTTRFSVLQNKANG